jgi:hypothetical protein
MSVSEQRELKKEDLDRHLHTALQSVEEVLEDKGDLPLSEVSKKFSHAVRCMVELRNHIIAAEAGAGTDLPHSLRLDNVNAQISMMASIEYPRAGVQWSRIDQIRNGLQQMLKP